MIKPEIEEFLRLRGTQIGDYEHNKGGSGGIGVQRKLCPG